MRATVLLNMGESAAAIEVAEQGVVDVSGLPGAEPALLALVAALSRATSKAADWEAQGRYTERALVLAEALSDPDARAHAHIQMGMRYQSIGAPATGLASNLAALGIAREHDLPGPLSRALTNVAAAENCRNLTASLAHSAEAIEVSRRAGLQTWQEFSLLNHVIALWIAGRYDEARPLVAELWETTADVTVRPCLVTLDGWLADAQGKPATLWAGESDVVVDDVATLAWVGSGHLTRARVAGDRPAAVALAEEVLGYLQTLAGLEDDFMILWPPTVFAALEAGDPDLADRLLEPVAEAPSGLVPPGVAAQSLRLRGLVGAARSADPVRVEADLRAGIDALSAFGAVGESARAQEELARWLVAQDRAEEAEPLVAAARTTYADIGAQGWLAQLDGWDAGRLTTGPARASAPSRG